MSRACCAGPNEISNIKPAQRWTVLFHTLDCVVPHVVGRCLHMCWQSSTPRDLPFVCFFQCERREGGRIPHTRLLSTLQMMMRPEILPNVFEPPPPLFEIVAFIIILIQWRENLPPIAVFVQENGIESCSGIESLGLCCSHVRLEKPRVDERSLLRKK